MKQIIKSKINYKKIFLIVIFSFIFICATSIVRAGSVLIAPIDGTYSNGSTGVVVTNLSEKATTIYDTMKADVFVDLTDFTIPSVNSDKSVSVVVVQANNNEILASNIKTIIDGKFQSPEAHLHPYDGMSGQEFYKSFPTPVANGNNVKVIITGSSGKKYFESSQFRLFEYTNVNVNTGNNTNTNSNNTTNPNTNTGSSNSSNSNTNNTNSNTVTVVDNSIKLTNPIGTDDFMSFISMILDIALKIGIPIATGFFIWAGFQYVLAQGNPTKVTAAHNNLKYVVFGTILFLGAWSITDVIIKTYKSVTGS